MKHPEGTTPEQRRAREYVAKHARCPESYTPWRSQCDCGDCEVAHERYNEAREED